MRASRRQRQRRAWRDAVQAGARGRARRGAGGGRVRRRRGRAAGRGIPAARPQPAARRTFERHPRGFGSGVSAGSICSRRCSNAGGSESRSPRCSGSSSVAKPGPERRELEEDPVRLAEVDGLEVEAVDHGGRAHARLGDPLLPGLVLVHVRRPRDVVNRARARDPAALGRRVVRVEAAALVAARLPFVLAARLERERLLEQRAAALRVDRVRAHAVEALERVLLRNLRMLGHERLVVGLVDLQLVPDAFRVLEDEAPVRPLELCSASPRRCSQKSSASAEPTRQAIVCTMPAPALPRAAPGYSKNVMSEPGVCPSRPRRRGGRRSGRPG